MVQTSWPRWWSCSGRRKDLSKNDLEIDFCFFCCDLVRVDNSFKFRCHILLSWWRTTDFARQFQCSLHEVPGPTVCFFPIEELVWNWFEMWLPKSWFYPSTFWKQPHWMESNVTSSRHEQTVYGHVRGQNFIQSNLEALTVLNLTWKESVYESWQSIQKRVVYTDSGQNYLFIFMPCVNWSRPLSVVRISAFSDFESTHAKQGYRYRVVPCR